MALIDYAIKLTGNGFAVMPNKPGTARPMLDTSPYQHQPPMMSKVRLWFMQPEVTGMGFIAGKPSGNLEVISFETMDAYHKAVAWIKDNPRAREVLDKVLAIEEKTPTGMQWYYRCNATWESSDLALFRQQDGSLSCQIRTIGEGEYTAAAPSDLGFGRRYTLVKGMSHDGMAVLTTEQRHVLIDRIKAISDVEDIVNRIPGEMYTAPEGFKKCPDESYDRHTAWSDLLEPHGWAARRYDDFSTLWSKPKSEGVYHAISHKSGGLFVFSSDAAPFEPGRNYSKFAAHAILNHKGSFDAAGEELFKSGFGRVDASVSGDHTAKRRPMQERIGVRTAAEIRDRYSNDDPGYIMNDVLPPGLTMLACPYKFDTAHIALDMCLTVGNPGRKFLGLYEFAVDTDCLYFSLEDTEFMLNERIDRLLDMQARHSADRYTMSDRVKITMDKPPAMDESFCDILDEYLTVNPRCKLIVIDSYNAIVNHGTAWVSAVKQKKHAAMLRKIATRHGANIFMTMRVLATANKSMFGNKINPVMAVKQSMPIAGMSEASMVVMHEAHSAGMKVMLHTGGRYTKPRVHELRKRTGVWCVKEKYTNVIRHKYVDEIQEYCDKTGKVVFKIADFERWLWDEHKMKSQNMQQVFKRLYLMNYLNRNHGEYWLTL